MEKDYKRIYEYLNKINFQKRIDNGTFRTSEHFPDTNLIGPGAGHKESQSEQSKCRDQ